MVCVGIGGKIYMDSKKLEEMVIVVKSEEAKNIFENGLRNLDQKALTPEGVIQSYEIDYDSIEKNPMGGINVTLQANKKNDLYVFFTLNKNSENILVDDGGGNSSELEKLLEEKN
ncbi:DUF1310 family protein [Carnobacterium maltaromaticum]|uniref:DUF1310 family protein n=1 Tax=Carnobacterium maltaromaticum TaxID=2751 RepID=UPI002ED1DB67